MSAHPALHLAIGAFDGVHLGHRAVLHSARDLARETKGQVGIMTFDPHPSRVLRPQSAVPLIFNRAQKDERLTEAGAQLIHHHTFDAQHAAMEAGEFPIWLQKNFPNLKSLHVGTNFQYGRNRSGNNQTLSKDAAALGIKVHLVDPVILENEPVSSSRIRAALTSGAISIANQMLLRPYEAVGTIIPGKQIGRRIGFPTINLDWHPELLPAFGVYAVELVTPSGVAEPSIANWGLRPTVEAAAPKPVLEVHLLRPTETLPTHGESLRVRWLDYIRPEQKFADLAALERQIKSDVQKASAVHGLS